MSDFLKLADVFETATAPLWALIDGANCSDLPALRDAADHTCLYRQPGDHAPWLLRLDRDSALARDLQDLPGDLHWGYVIEARGTRDSLRAHFRRFTMVRTPAQPEAPVYFRFYDPRVMLDAIDALEPKLLTRLLGPVSRIALPLSPLLGPQTELSPFAKPASYRGQFFCPDLPTPCDGTTTGPFAISPAAMEAMNFGQRNRATRKLARRLLQSHPTASEPEVIAAAGPAADRAATYGLTSVDQVRLFATCLLRAGLDFDRRDARAMAILQTQPQPAWQKAAALQDWLDTRDVTARAAS